jgi:methyl-accepting chemotaxis protein
MPKTPAGTGGWSFGFSTKRLSLLAKLYLLIVVCVLLPLAGVAALVGSRIRAGSGAGHVADLTRALQVKELAVKSLSLVLLQDDLSKSILLDPDRLAPLSERKIQAFDDNIATREQMVSVTDSQELRSIVRRLEVAEERDLRPLDTKILELVLSGDPEQAKRVYFSDYAPVQDDYIALIKTLTEVAERDAQAAVIRKDENDRRMLLEASGILGGAIIVIGGVLLLATRRVSTRLKEIAAVAEGIADRQMANLTSEARLISQGDLTRLVQLERLRLEVESEDEVGKMAASFNRMLDRLGEIGEALNSISGRFREVVLQVQGTATEIASDSGSVAQSAEFVARGSESAVQAVEGISAAIHELDAAIQTVTRSSESQAASSAQNQSSAEKMLGTAEQVARAAETLLSIAERADRTVAEGQKSMSSSSDAMSNIQRVIGTSADSARALGGMTAEISTIVKAIDDIAEQTNLLALNATIEAARAGEYGLGFAVVADEVRKLAERSARSTREISELIRGIESHVTTAVRHAGDSASIVEDGMNRVQELRAKFDDIGASVSEVFRCSREISDAITQQTLGARSVEEVSGQLSDLTLQINTATQEQSNGTQQVVTSIEQIRGMAHQNANSAGNLAALADQLSRQAGVMRDLVAHFQVKDMSFLGQLPPRALTAAKDAAPARTSLS